MLSDIASLTLALINLKTIVLVRLIPTGSHSLFIYFETEFLCVIALTDLELVLVDQAGLELTEIGLPLPPECWY